MATNVVASIMATLGLDISDYQDKLEKARNLAGRLPTVADNLFTSKDDKLLKERIKNIQRSADVYDQMANSYRSMSGQATQAARRELAATETKLRDAEAYLAKVRQETTSAIAEKSKSATIKAIEREVREAESQLRKAQTQAEKASKAFTAAKMSSAASSGRVADTQVEATRAQNKEAHSKALAEATRAQIVAKQAAIAEATAEASTIRGAARLNLLYKQLETLKTRLAVQENTIAERARITARALQAQADAQQNVAKAAREAMLASSGVQTSNRNLRRAEGRLSTARLALDTARNADAGKYTTSSTNAEVEGNRRVLAAVHAVEAAKNNVAKAQDRVNNAVNKEVTLEQRAAKAAQQAETARTRAAALVSKIGEIKVGDMGLGSALVSAGALYGSLQAIQSLMESLVKPGFEYAQTMEQARVGIAATLRSMTKLDDQPINMTQALSAADSLVDKLNTVSIMTGGTKLADVLRTYQGLLGPGLGAGLDTQQLIEYTQTGINAAKAMQLPANQFIQELRDLVQGGISAQSSTIASALGLRDADIQAAKESAEGLFAFLMQKMQGYNDMAGMTFDTISGKMGLLEGAIERASGKLTEAFAPEIKSLLDLVTSMFATLDREAGTFTINPEILEFIDRLHMKYMEILDIFGDFDVDGKFYPSEETLAKLEALKNFGGELVDAFFGALDWLIKMEPVLEAIGRAVATVVEDAIVLLGYVGDILLVLRDHADAVETVVEWMLKLVVIPGMILSGLGLVITAFTTMLAPIGKAITLLWRMVKAVRAIGVAAAIARLGIVGMTLAAMAGVGVVGAAGGKTLAEGSGWEGFKANLSQMASTLGESIGNAIDAVTGSGDEGGDEAGFLERIEQRQKELRDAWEQRMANWGLGMGKGDPNLARGLKADPKQDDKAAAKTAKAAEKADKERLRELQRRLKEAIEAEKYALEDIKQNIQSQMKKLDVIWKQGLMSAEEYYTRKADLEKQEAQAEYDSLARELELIQQTEYEQEAVKNREILKVQREMMKVASKLGEAVDSFKEVNRFARETAILQRNAQGAVSVQAAAQGGAQVNAQAGGISGALPNDISGIPHSVVAYKMLTQQGFSDAIAKGIIASLMGESGRDLSTTEVGDYGTSYGVGQWHNERWDDLVNFANANHSDINDIRTQIAFLIHEITQGTQTDAFQQMLDYLKEYGETAENAARAWTIFVERPAARYARGEERIENLQYVNADLEAASHLLTTAATAQLQAAGTTEAAAQGAYKLYTRSTELEGEGVTWVRQTPGVDMENLTSRAKFMWNNMAAWFYEHYGKPLIATSGYRGNGEHFGDAIDYRGYIDLGDINSFDLFTDRDVWNAFTDYIQNFLRGGNADEYRDTTYGGWHGHADASGRNWTNAANGWGPAEYGGVDVNMAANAVASQSVQNAAETLAKQQAAALLEQADKAFTEALLQEAESWKGTPYKYGGTDKNGVDCSAFVQNVFKAQGMELARTADAQAQQYMDSGAFRKDIENIRAGDLVFFRGHDTGINGIGHVGLYIGNGKFLDSSTTGVPVGEDTLSRRSDFVGYGDTRALFKPELKTAYSTALTEAGAEAKEAINKQYEDFLEKIATAFDLVGKGAEVKLLIEQRKFDELKNQFNSAHASFRKMAQEQGIDPDGTLEKIWQQAGTAIEWLHNQKVFEINFKDIEAKQELKLKELATTAERAAGNIGIFVQSLDKMLSDANINIVDATEEVKRYGNHFFFNEDSGVLSDMRKIFNRLSQLSTEAEMKGILESWWQVQDAIKKGMDGYADAVQKMRESSSSFYDYRDQKLSNDATLTDLQRSEREENLKRGRAASELRIDTAALNTWKRLAAELNEQMVKLIAQYEELNKQNELTDADKEKLSLLNTEIQKLSKGIQDINSQRILPLERAVELNKQLAHIPTQLEKIWNTGSKALENGLVTFLTDGINEAESLGDALRDLAVTVLKDLQKMFAEEMVRGWMNGLRRLFRIDELSQREIAPDYYKVYSEGENGKRGPLISEYRGQEARDIWQLMQDNNINELQAIQMYERQKQQATAADTQALTAHTLALNGNKSALLQPGMQGTVMAGTYYPANFGYSGSVWNNTWAKPQTLPGQQPYSFDSSNYDILTGLTSQMQTAATTLTQPLTQVGQEAAQVGTSFIQLDSAAAPAATSLSQLAGEASTTVNSLQTTLSSYVPPLETALTQLITAVKTAASAITAAATSIGSMAMNAGGGGDGVAAALGGFISGPGTSTSDSIPARLSNGEFVMRAKAVRQYGRSMMERINNGTWGNIRYNVPAFAKGGYVGQAGAAAAQEGITGLSTSLNAPVTVRNYVDGHRVFDAYGRDMVRSEVQRVMVRNAKLNAEIASKMR